MKKTSFVIIGCMLVCLLAGCATPYQSKEGIWTTGGFRDSQLGPDEFLIFFEANAFAGGERCRDFCMLRAAELTLEKGFSHFVVLGDLARDVVQGSSGNVFTHPRNELQIKCFKSKPERVNSYDAAFLKQSLRQKYGI